MGTGRFSLGLICLERKLILPPTLGQEDNVTTDYLEIMIVQMGEGVTFWSSSRLQE